MTAYPAPVPPTFGLCACGHGEHVHELKRDNVTRTYCTRYFCDCKRYDERDRYSLHLIRRAAGYGDPPRDED